MTSAEHNHDDNEGESESQRFTPDGQSLEYSEPTSLSEHITRLCDMILNKCLEEQKYKLIQWWQCSLDALARRRPVYVKKFSGKTGDYIDFLLKSFQVWFRHRGNVEGNIPERQQIDTAMQQTKWEIYLDLARHESQTGKLETWNDFANYMRQRYGSQESGFMRFLRLKRMKQGSTESVESCYTRFCRELSRQTPKMSDPRHSFIYMFFDALQDNLTQEMWLFPETWTIE
jgi:hypothetical protein